MILRRKRIYSAFLIALITLVTFQPVLRYDFVNWDDDIYIYKNPNLHALDWPLIKWAFTSFYASNWHPLTWLSHGLDYSIWGLNPAGHHFTNIFLHAVNSFLVVIVCLQLLAKCDMPGVDRPSNPNPRSLLIACITGLLFGLHPLHVESVAWVTERKDLLAALFYLLSIWFYLRYMYVAAGRNLAEILSKGSAETIPYILSITFFILALMSKPMAVSLPFVLLLLDWYPFQRIRSSINLVVVLLEKTPFIALSFLSSIVTIQAQQGGIHLMEHVSYSSRLLVASNAYVVYLVKIIAPTGLIPYYSYPDLLTIELRSPRYWISLAVLLGIGAGLVLFAKRIKPIVAAAGYYFVTLIPVIGIVQVGTQVIADRYTYLPSIGPFILIGCIAAFAKDSITTRHERFKLLVIVGAVISVLIMTGLTLRQMTVWKNSVAVWTAVIEQDPNCDSLAYFNRGAAYGDRGQYELVIADESNVISKKPFAHLAYMNRGAAFDRLGRLPEALSDYSRVISIAPNFTPAIVARGKAYIRSGLVEQAVADFRQACTLGNDAGCNGVLLYGTAGGR